MTTTKPLLSQNNPYYSEQVGYDAMMKWYDSALARLPIQFETDMVGTRFGGTHLLIAGPPNKVPLVLLHSTNGNAALWKPFLATIARTHRIYVPDIVGAAGRSAPVRLPYSGSGYLDWLLDVLADQKLNRVVLVGTGGGAFISLKMAAKHPGRVRALALINPCGIAPYRWPYDLLRRSAMSKLMHAVSHLRTNGTTAQRMLSAETPEGKKPDAELVEMTQLLLRYYKRNTPPGPLPEQVLQRITVPTLIAMGAQEPYLDHDKLLAQAQHTLKKVRIHTLPESGHYAYRDQPEAIAALIDFFLHEHNIE